MASLSCGPSAVGHGVHDHGKDGKQDVLSASPRIISIALLPPLMQVLLVVVERLRFASVTLARRRCEYTHYPIMYVPDLDKHIYSGKTKRSIMIGVV